MKKLFLSVLALVVLVGTIFASSDAWSFTPAKEACFQSDVLAVDIADQGIIPIGNTEENNLLESHLDKKVIQPAATIEELGVSSFFPSPCSMYLNANPGQYLTACWNYFRRGVGIISN